MSFWDALEAHIAALDDETTAPDPWGGTEVEGGELTDAQRDFLEGLADQPAIPHLDGDAAVDEA
jgi:hypothetical protein